MRIFTIITLCALPIGCTPTQNTAPAAPEYALESCLDRALASEQYKRADTERAERNDANAKRKLELGFTQDHSKLPDSHIPPLPVRPPVMSFPTCAAENGLNGYCNVVFDVDVTGTPIHIDPNCSHPVFDREAARAVSRAEFRPATIDGEPVEYPGVIYPISLTLEY